MAEFLIPPSRKGKDSKNKIIQLALLEQEQQLVYQQVR